jgi:hypothetical protein
MSRDDGNYQPFILMDDPTHKWIRYDNTIKDHKFVVEIDHPNIESLEKYTNRTFLDNVQPNNSYGGSWDGLLYVKMSRSFSNRIIGNRANAGKFCNYIKKTNKIYKEIQDFSSEYIMLVSGSLLSYNAGSLFKPGSIKLQLCFNDIVGAARLKMLKPDIKWLKDNGELLIYED